jgi:thiol-disulfide isomerase/thioredoxin
LLNNVMLEFNPFDSKYNSFASLSFFNSLQATSKFINESGIEVKSYNKNLWKNKNVREFYNVIPLQYQERLFAYLLVNDRLNENDLTQFKKIFPKSKYLQYLERYLKSKKSITYKTGALGYFINNNFEYSKQTKNSDINEIINGNFKGKAVFVDLWASYCAPCFEEFSNSQKLFAFLKTNNIELLYIAIDNERDIAKWYPNIKRNYLEGNHIFASDKIQESLHKLLNEPKGVYIPRYLLFNSNGKLVISNAKKPSEGKILFDEIINALK